MNLTSVLLLFTKVVSIAVNNTLMIIFFYETFAEDEGEGNICSRDLPCCGIPGSTDRNVSVAVAKQLSTGGAHKQNDTWSASFSCLMFILVTHRFSC